jgi:PKD repeat protein
VDHVFNESRIFNVTLTVTDNNGTSNMTWIFIDVLSNAQPNAAISDPDSGDFFNVNETIFFNASGSSDLNDEDLEYYWDFGDGNNSDWITEPTYNYTYKQKALPPTYGYTVTLTVRDNEMSEDQDTIEVMIPNDPPVSKLKSNLTETYTGNMTTFWGNESEDDDGSILNYTWEFGDGTIYTETSISAPDGTFDGIARHSYEDDGIYTVNLTVTDNAQLMYPGINPARNTTSITITIINREPTIIEATADPETTATGETIYFNVTGQDSDGNITMYEWNFGQSYVDYTSTSGEATHSFNTKGKKSVWVRITDDDGAQATEELIVNITNAPPEVTITNPTNGEEVTDVVIIEGTASDPEPGDTVTEVYVKIDDTSEDWYLADGTDSWTFQWDTREVNNGEHTIYAKSYDGDNYSAEASISVTVDNPPTDIEATMDFNQNNVETGATVRVFGDVIYQNGDPVENALVNVTIQNQDDYWTNLTESDGTYSVFITAPDTAGNYDVRVTATKGGFSDITTKRLYVSAPPAEPDLEILSSDIDFNPSAPESGHTVLVTVTVRNIGDAEATNVLVNAYNGDPEAGGTQIEPKGSETITVSATDSEEVYLDWDTTDLAGQFFIYVELDRDDRIEEADEDNNKAYKMIDVSGMPDFAVEPKDISFSKNNPKVDETIDIRINIHNLGTETGEVDYEVYDGDPDGSGLLIDSNSETVTKNQFETVTVKWTPEEGGDREIYVVLISSDDDNDDNNQANKTISVESLPGEEGIPSWLLPLLLVCIVVVVVLLLFLYMRGRGAKPQQKLPVAQVIKKEEKPKTAEVVTEEEEEPKSMLESHGGIRLG